jgi:cytochrome c
MRSSLVVSAMVFAWISALSAADIERGRTIYSQICFNCH